MPRLAAFPKAFMDALCVNGSMSLRQWIELSAALDIDGLEFYFGFLDLQDPGAWAGFRRMVEDQGRSIPMLCCSPDFTHPDPAFRSQQVQQEKLWIDLTASLGGRYCRVLSGQRRPGVSRAEGIGFVVDCIHACVPHARAAGVTLVLENHYKDNYWEYPEFAQHGDVFCDLVERIDPRNDLESFGINYDPSNAILAGENPLELLRRVKHRVVTMHASDRYLAEGSIEDLRREELDSAGYARRLCHGQIGEGLNDYDAIFTELRGAGFDGWISIEDGVEGLEQIQCSAGFLRKKIAAHWPSPRPGESRSET